MNYLLVDIGSTYTKLHLVDFDQLKLLASAKSYTTVDTDVRVGYERALETLKRQGSSSIDRILGCSSAAGGLKVVVVGFSRNLTTEAARLASLSSGARILKVYSYELKERDLEEIQSLGADIVVLCGGTEGGNESNILFNARAMAEYGLQIPVVVAGNSKAQEPIHEVFERAGMYHVMTDNVMPSTNVVHYKPLRETMGRIFIENIAKAKGIDALSRTFELLLPTPIAVQRAVSNFSHWEAEEVMSIDIGGATTDVMSIAQAYKGEEEILSPIMEEPYEKRSVEGDMGMRYSALAMYESVGEDLFHQLGGREVLKNITYRFEHPDFVPVDPGDFQFDEIMGKVATLTSMKRHMGRIKKKFTGTRYVYEQFGKDLRAVKYLLGTGGVLIHSRDPRGILQMVETLESSYLSPRNLRYFIDEQYLLSSVGLLTSIDEEKAYVLLKKYMREC